MCHPDKSYNSHLLGLCVTCMNWVFRPISYVLHITLSYEIQYDASWTVFSENASFNVSSRKVLCNQNECDSDVTSPTKIAWNIPCFNDENDRRYSGRAWTQSDRITAIKRDNRKRCRVFVGAALTSPFLPSHVLIINLVQPWQKNWQSRLERVRLWQLSCIVYSLSGEYVVWAVGSVGIAYCGLDAPSVVHCCCTWWFYWFLVDSASPRATN